MISLPTLRQLLFIGYIPLLVAAILVAVYDSFILGVSIAVVVVGLGMYESRQFAQTEMSR